MSFMEDHPARFLNELVPDDLKSRFTAPDGTAISHGAEGTGETRGRAPAQDYTILGTNGRIRFKPGPLKRDGGSKSRRRRGTEKRLFAVSGGVGGEWHGWGARLRPQDWLWWSCRRKGRRVLVIQGCSRLSTVVRVSADGSTVFTR